MRIAGIGAQLVWELFVLAEDGRVGRFDVAPYLEFEAFAPLRDHDEFTNVINGGYFVEWECGADLSADTVEARWILVDENPSRTTA